MRGNHPCGPFKWFVIGGLVLAWCGEANSPEAYGQAGGGGTRRAPAARPGPDRLPPRAGVPAARPIDGPRDRLTPLGVRPIPARHSFLAYQNRPHYWWPYYSGATPVVAYRSLGYPYYVGGTSYVTVREETTTTTTADGSSVVAGYRPSTQPAESEQGTSYLQVLQLAELVHAWRTMNESPRVHERIAAAGTPAETVEKIKAENAAFDTDTRVAARLLSQGGSADAALVSASNHLETLNKLMESLPNAGTTSNP